MLNLLSSPFLKTSLGIFVLINCFQSLTENTMGATFRLFPDTFIEETLSLKMVTTQDLIGSDLLAELMTTPETTTTIDNGLITEASIDLVSEQSNLSFESIVASLTQIKLDVTTEGRPTPEVPILPQVGAPDIYKEIYDFSTTSAQELSDPVSVGLLPSLDPIPTPRGGVVASTRIGLPGGIATPGLNNASLPRFGGPVQIIGKASANFTNPLRQVNLPSANKVQAGNWGDSQIDVFFASLPEAEIGNIDVFMRTIYRTSPSEMIKRIDETLDLTIDTEFHSMPVEIFPANAMPSGDFNTTL